MPASEFVGDLSPFEIIVAAIALLTGAYTFYKSFIERARLALYPGDQIGLVASPGQACHKFHLRCNLVNRSTKMATVHRLEGRIRDPRGNECTYIWHQFFEYVPGGHAVQKSADPHPISVPPKNSQPQFIEFKTEASNPNFQWQEGKYAFRIEGWVNCKSRKRRANLCSRFHIRVDELLSMILGGTKADQDSVVPVPISEWTGTG
jgi:hypothetical protein